jgi:hypothetical protein
MPHAEDDRSPDPQPAAEPQLKLRGGDVAARAFKDETIVLDLRSSMYLSTNPAGTVLWRRLEQGATRAELIAALLDEFEVDAGRASTDVDAFLADCRRRDLLAD